MNDVITVSPKYQVVIPKSVRERVNIKPGQKLAVMATDGVIKLVPILPLEELYGIAPDINLDDIRDETDRF